MDTESIKSLRVALGLSQRRIAVLSHFSQTAISLMEAGKLAIDRRYAAWLEAQVYGKYRRVAGMPKRVLRFKIKNRSDV